MIEENKECYKVMVQMKAAKSALNSLMNKFIEENFIDCINNDCKSGKKRNEENLKKIFIELTKNN